MSRREMRVAAAGLLRAHHTGRRRVLVSTPLPPVVPSAPLPWWRRLLAWIRTRYSLEGWME